MKRILIAAAGTGGHVFPALAVAEQLRQYGWQVVWLGSDEGRLESRVVPAAGFQLQQIHMQGLRGHGVWRKLSLPFTLLRAFWQCRRVLRAQPYHVMLSFGGYVCAPAGLAARWCGVPLLIHEQNAIPGMTNRWLARIAQQTLLGFAAAQQYLPQGQVVGNPLRQAWMQPVAAKSSAETGVFKLLVVGGSLGAQALNQAVPAALALLAGEFPLQVRHQTGRGQQAAVSASYQRAAVAAEVVEFIDDMHSAYAEADVVIARAGALTVAELAMVGTPAIFVPLPHAVDDHQTANAQTLVSVGAARLLPQSELLAIRPLIALLKPLLASAEVRAEMRAQAQRVARPDATEAVISYCEQWAKAEQTSATRESS